MLIMFQLVDAAEWMRTALTTIALWLDWIVYELLTYAYALFAVMCRLNFSSLQILLSTIVVRIQILFGVVMLFIVAFNLLTLIIDPSDKKIEQNGTKLGVKIIVSIGLLVVGNFVFGLLDNLQNAILNESVIEKVIVGANEGNAIPSDNGQSYNQYESFISSGRWISYHLFFSFYKNSTPELEEGVLNGKLKFYNIVIKSKDTIKYEYPIISTFCGLLAIVMYVTFAIDIGVRALNIMILRVILPVAAMGYIIPKKGEEILKKYITTYFSTYAQLFAKIFISYLIVYLMMALMSLLLTHTANNVVSQGMIDAFENQNFLSSFPIFFRVILLILIFISLYFFYKKLPELISKILGVEITSGKGLIAKTMGIIGGVASLTLGAAAGFAGGLATGIAGGIRGKAGFVGAAKAAMHNAGQGVKKNVGKGLTKLGNNTIGEKTTGKISSFAQQHNSEARAQKRKATEDYANAHASDRVKERKAEAAKESAAKQKLQEEETLNRLRETSNSNVDGANQQKPVTPLPVDNSKPLPVDNSTSIEPKTENSSHKPTEEDLERQRKLKETLKTKYQTRMDDELRNQGGQMDSQGNMHAPTRNMGGTTDEENSIFTKIDPEEFKEYQHRLGADEIEENLEKLDESTSGEKSDNYSDMADMFDTQFNNAEKSAGDNEKPKVEIKEETTTQNDEDDYSDMMDMFDNQ